MHWFIIASLTFWRIFLEIISLLAKRFIPQRLGFLGPSVWANFDGLHYLSIAKISYVQYEQAFFPLYPWLIKKLSFFLGHNFLLSAFVISYFSFFISLVLLFKLVRLDFNKKVAKRSLLLLLIFPTSFFFASVYTESLFLALILGSFYAVRKKKWWLAGVLGCLASATRLIGIILLLALIIEWKEQIKKKRYLKDLSWLILIPLGLFSYMSYLWKNVQDPLFFFHAQPAFGANRSGGRLVLIYQVIWRYLKIFFTVPVKSYDFWIAILEFVMAISFLYLAIISYFKVRKSYGLFSILIIILPTLTGTFSSIPRYVLPAFSVFILIGCIKNNKIYNTVVVLSLLLSIILTALFTRGWWVS